MNIVDVLGVTYKIKSSGLKTICLKLSLNKTNDSVCQSLFNDPQKMLLFLYSTLMLFSIFRSILAMSLLPHTMTFSKIGKNIRELIFHKVIKLNVKVIHLVAFGEETWVEKTQIK